VQTLLQRGGQGLGSGVEAELLEGVLNVIARREPADPELAGDLLGREPRREEPQGLDFPSRQARKIRRQSGHGERQGLVRWQSLRTDRAQTVEEAEDFQQRLPKLILTRRVE
jgi:hypothetical protein